MKISPLEFIRFLIMGKWSCGWGAWRGKPMLGAFIDWYDYWHFVIHVYKFWIEVD